MYFLVDAIFIVLLIFLIWVSIKFGFTRNFVFGIIRTIIGIAGAIGACVGVYLLMENFGWLDFMADGVANFFGMGADLRIVAKIVAYLPFAVLFLIVGYITITFKVNRISHHCRLWFENTFYKILSYGKHLTNISQGLTSI